MISFLYGAIVGFAGAYLLHSSISHHAAAAPPAPAKPVPINIPYAVSDTACTSSTSKNSASIMVSVNGISYVTLLDTGAAVSVVTPSVAASIKLTSFPKGVMDSIRGVQGMVIPTQRYMVPVAIPGLSPVTMSIETGPGIICNAISALDLASTYNITFGTRGVTFTHV